jgi:flagellar protein FlaG
MKIDTSINISNTTMSSTGNVESKAIEISKELSKEISNRDVKNENEFSEGLIDKSIEQANKVLEKVNRKIERHVHEKTKAIIFRIMDTETNKVIKEFPPEKIQDMIAKMWELAGLFVDERA